jgi:hypothetical protein
MPLKNPKTKDREANVKNNAKIMTISSLILP